MKEFKAHGSRLEDLQAKIIGGAAAGESESQRCAGVENTEIARRLLKKFGIPIVAEDVGGLVGRRVEFFTSNGTIRFKRNEPQPAQKKEIKVLIIDDSAPMRSIIRKMLEGDPAIRVVGEAEDPIEASRLREKVRPDVLTLDLHMPRQDGVTYLREYMRKEPLPAIVLSDYSLKDTGPVMDALEAGAFDYVKKPTFAEIGHVGAILIEKIKAAAEANVNTLKTVPSVAHQSPGFLRNSFDPQHLANSMIVLGASTGGTEAIKVFLSGLPKSIPPILIVQHMPAGFTKNFAERLNEMFPFGVKEAEEGEKIQENQVYIAPGGRQMCISGRRYDLRISLTDDPPENRFRPSVDYLFRSFLKVERRFRMAVLLTGMGNDGARELLRLKQGGIHTIVQNEATSVVFGMPKAAIDLHADCEVRPLAEIPLAVMDKFADLQRKVA